MFPGMIEGSEKKLSSNPGISPCLHALFVYCEPIATITLTVTTEVHDKLKRLKIGKESFSEMLTRELPDRANTCGEVLEKLESKELPPMDLMLLKAIRSGRGRRSHRNSRHVR
jgi:predicted CopG family antitoxin